MKFEFYDPNAEIINLSINIGKLLGVIDTNHLRKPNPELRRSNQIKSIQSSLAIEGNSMSEEQITDILNDRRVIGPSKDIIEVKNAINVYGQLDQFKYDSIRSFRSAHKALMNGLIQSPGKFRTSGVGTFKEGKATHVAPPAWNVPNLMKNLFEYLKKGEDSLIIKSCVFHYELEFIHPFLDGNGRMGRLWQTVILMKENPVFEFLPIEQEIKNKQLEYYNSLEQSDKIGTCTAFVVFMLKVLEGSLENLIGKHRSNFTEVDRINYFVENYTKIEFVRKDYMKMFREISTSTATRDMNKGLQFGIWERIGQDRLTKYKILK